MAILTCECCERENDVPVMLTFVGTVVECPCCGARHRIKDIEARLVTELQRAPANFGDGEGTPIQVPNPRPGKERP